MEVTITKRFREKEVKGNVYNYTSVTQAGAIYKPIEPAIIPFTVTALPEILNYKDEYAMVYGQYPKVQLYTYDENGYRVERIERPLTVTDDDGIVSIGWELGKPEIGFIILYPTQG